MNHEVVAKAYAFAAATGIPWPTIWTWIETVLWSKSSLSIIEQVIAIILSIVGQGGTVDWTKLAAYGSAVVQALINGQPVPPYTP